MKQVELIETVLINAGNNDRTSFNEQDLRTLADSIHANGLAQPITLRKINGRFEIVAGERRFRACSMLGWDTIPALVSDLTDEQASAIMLAENTARVDLDPVDEARAFQNRIWTMGWSVSDCARNAGVSEIYVHFRLKLLSLSEDIQHLVRHGNLPVGYARILADANLDKNRQRLAIRRLNANEHSTPVWFRQVCNELIAQQSQETMFDMTALLQPVPAGKEKPTMPPLPGKDAPPVVSGGAETVIKSQIDFWNNAAEQWSKLGKSFKRQECEAASSALQSALNAIQSIH